MSSLTIASKYVNMTDVMQTSKRNKSGSPQAENSTTEVGNDHFDCDESLMPIIELLFFAYRDFISEPDEILGEFGFGRAHHRVLHFVSRHPGLRVADLLEILKITKQSLARVLKQLVEEDFIVQQAGRSDRRERRLFTTQKGSQLARDLATPQLNRIGAAIADLDKDKRDAVTNFLYSMITDKDRKDVSRIIGQSQQLQRRSV